MILSINKYTNYCSKHVKLRLLYSGEFKKQKQSGKIYAEGIIYIYIYIIYIYIGLPESLIIHIHGGGFISGSSKNSEIYTRKWTKELKVPIISIDYGLTPEHKYPDQLNDIWNAYYWLITQGPTQLGKELILTCIGLKINTVILGGDSQGASLCMGLTLLCIRRKFISPHGLILGYPRTYLHIYIYIYIYIELLGSVERFVPSLLMGLEDINQRYTSMEILNQAYGSSFGKPLDDPFLSPLLIPHKVRDYLLEKYRIWRNFPLFEYYAVGEIHREIIHIFSFMPLCMQSTLYISEYI